MLQGPDDGRDALLTIHPGAGGTESQDWAEMLMRMYVRWAERHGFEVTILDLLPGEEAGIKSVSIQIKGEYAYGYLKAEKGVHRLVRISPYDSQARRHTSFASVFVYPDIDDTIEIDIRDEDIKMDVFRASGAGGQHVNKTSSAVRLTHVPTGVVVSCQQERSQTKNSATAMKMLRAALYQRKLEEQEAARAVVEATKTDNSWGNQIRSYVFQPYTMVNDHRTEVKVGDVQRVMDGRSGHLHPGVPQAVRRKGGVSTVEDRTYVETARREKRAALEAAGIPAFAYRYERTHTASQAVALYQDEMGETGPAVAVAGRIVALRSQGKTTFAHLEDPSGRIQVYFKRDLLASQWDLVQLLDLDDHVGVKGASFAPARGKSRSGRPRSCCWPSRCDRCRAGRHRRARKGRRPSVDSPIPRSATGSGMPISPCIPTCARSSSFGAGWSAISGGFSTHWAFSKWKRRCCSRSTAARRRGRS